MKFFGRTRDGAIDNLLRAYVSRPSNPHQVCPDFDPDLANAYVERSLSSSVRLHYESHMSACAACRKSVVVLMRMAEADSIPTLRVPQSTWLSGVKQMFGALSQPQWAMAATAVIVLAISLPLFLTRNQSSEMPQTAASQPSTDSPVTTAPPASPLSGPRPGDAPALVASSKPLANSDDSAATLMKVAPAAATAQEAPAEFAAAGELSKKADKNAAEPLDLVQRKAEVQVTPPPPQTGAASSSQVARNDADQNRQQQPEKDSAQQVSAPKMAARVNEGGAKQKTERAEVVAAPPPSEPARERSGFRRPGQLALRDSNTTEAVRPEERKFSGKKFLFKDGAWTDKDFNPNKELPVVTIIRDSNVYKEVLTKRPGLKPFLTGFQATERAIIVYKGTVYKLIPQ